MRFCGADKKKRGTSWAREEGQIDGGRSMSVRHRRPPSRVRKATRVALCEVVSSLSIFAKKVSGLKALKELKDWEFGVRGGKEGDISHKGLMRGRGQVRRRSVSFKC